ncbi:MAG: hypothetical protein AB1767_06920 [Bacillota bacterium]
MIVTKCPGQDTRYWTADDIHEQPCPHCGSTIEFWKTDIRVRCPNCKQKVTNPRFNLGCAAWCAYSEKCLGAAAKGVAPQPLRRVLEVELGRILQGLPLQQREIKEKMEQAETQCRAQQIEPLPVLAALVVLKMRKLDRLKNWEQFIEKLTAEYQFPIEAAEETSQIINNVLQGRLDGAKEKISVAQT